MLFVLSTVKNLIPVTKLHEDGPQALFVTPDDNVIDLRSNYLTHLEKVEGLPIEDFLRKARNAEKEFAYLDSDDDKERNKKDTAKLIYSPERFIMGRMYHTADRETLTNPEKIENFVKEAVLQQLKPYWETEKTPKVKHSLKVTGEDLEKRILDSKKDALLLILHPTKEKNRHLPEWFEEFTRAERPSSGELTFARCNGINEA